MKTLNKFSKPVLFASGLLLVSAISATARQHRDWMPGDTLYLEGTSGATIQAIAEDVMLWDGSFYCEGWITFTGFNSFELTIAEHMPTPTGEVIVRVRDFDCRITPGGVVTFPDADLLENLVPHVGVTPHGRGIRDGVATYMGYLDELELDLSAHVIGRQTEPADYPFYWKDPNDPTVLFTGPIDLVFYFNLAVVE